MDMPKIPQTLAELTEMLDKLKAAGQGESPSAQYLEVLIEQKACEEAGVSWRE